VCDGQTDRNAIANMCRIAAHCKNNTSPLSSCSGLSCNRLQCGRVLLNNQSVFTLHTV